MSLSSSGSRDASIALDHENVPVLVLEDGEVLSNMEQWWRDNNVLVQGAAGLLCVIVVIFLIVFLDNPPKYLILISIDGFRPDYLDVYYNSTTNLRNLAVKGVKAEYLIPVFPTKTFPNHYTIVTGLFPESHGIVENSMFDPITNISYSISDPKQVTNGYWYGGEPIWVTAEKQNVKAGTLFWPGSEAMIGGRRPTYYLPYDKSMPYSERVRIVLDWLSYDLILRPLFITMYFENVDTEGHKYGPWSPFVEEAIREVDDTIGSLVSGIEKAGLTEVTNFILLSDHGMAAVNSSGYIFLDECIDLSAVDVIVWSPNAEIIPHVGKKEEVFRNLSECNNSHITTFYRENITERFHYSHNIRIPPIITMADLGWGITTTQNKNRPNYTVGSHGYDNEKEDMRAFFIGCGPNFAKEKEFGPISNIDLYSLMSHLLNIKEAPSNGTWENLKDILVE